VWFWWCGFAGAVLPVRLCLCGVGGASREAVQAPLPSNLK
jgi:hypothetical protein